MFETTDPPRTGENLNRVFLGERITCFPEGSELPPPCEPRRGSRPRGKLLLVSGVHCPAPGQRLAASRAGPRGSSSSGAALLDT